MVNCKIRIWTVFIDTPLHHLMWLCSLIKYKIIFILLSFSIIQYDFSTLIKEYIIPITYLHFIFSIIEVVNNIFHQSFANAHTAYIHPTIMIYIKKLILYIIINKIYLQLAKKKKCCISLDKLFLHKHCTYKISISTSN